MWTKTKIVYNTYEIVYNTYDNKIHCWHRIKPAEIGIWSLQSVNTYSAIWLKHLWVNKLCNGIQHCGCKRVSRTHPYKRVRRAPSHTSPCGTILWYICLMYVAVVSVNDACKGISCQHGGTCIANGQRHYCKCKHPYIGELCSGK